MIEYKLIRSDRRTLGLEITQDLTVVVRAPRWCSQGEIDRFVQRHEGWIQTHLPIQERRRQARLARRVTPEQEQILRRRAKEELPGRVAYYAQQMGVTPTGIKITGAEKRFGSCSGKNSLCFSWRLMLYPPDAVDYVVVHELAHIRHHDHSPAFWTFVEQTLPDYRQRQQLLRD